jgi:high affinity Mn2+ porin
MRWYLALVLACVPAGAAAGDDADYVLPHPDARWWLSGQLNVIAQGQPGFDAPYTGPHSFRDDDRAAASVVATIYAGYAITSTTAVVLTGESAGGGGLSDALGIAGFTNIDVVRNPTLGAAPYVGRAFIDQIIPLSDAEGAARDPLHPFARLPPRRIELRAGKLSTVDVFDVNGPGADSHLQFMNWTVDNNGAYDYAADTRGYTLGAIAEYIDRCWAIRLGELLMPTVANGIDYDTDLRRARGENLELELHDRLAGRAGVVRLLGYLNHANMGSYRDAIAAVRAQQDELADVTRYRAPGRRKYGLGGSAEQALPGDARAFARLGWSDGSNESFAYTEVDNTVELGGDLRGTAWRRPLDRLGLAVVTNGLSDLHRTYLALGGSGFLLGDGALHYGREDIVEAYYTARVYRGVSPAVDVQVIERPGYNRDRGPVFVGSLRLHVDL